MHDSCVERSHNVMDIHSKVMSITYVQIVITKKAFQKVCLCALNKDIALII